MQFDMSRRLASEAIGTAFLVCAIVGSGIMADMLSDDIAVSLLGNSLATGAILFALITILGPISGAHFNPAVTFAFCLKRDIGLSEGLMYIAAQIAGGLIGTMVAHLMFSLDIIQISINARTGGGQWIAESIATFGLVGIIFAGIRFNANAIPALVGVYIPAAIWFTASTSFANPAVAIARSVTDTFTGIRPIDLPGFIAAEFIGAAMAVAIFGWLLNETRSSVD
ncbi:MAG: aquaporin family protein [Roseovarius sp.]|nr:aquaporin family protein [Roseovarius sp.]MCY4206582.1 aquaporin family protein [Roseovarius sp.]